MDQPIKFTFEIGDYDKLEAQKLERWRTMTKQERLDEYVKLLKIWLGGP